METVSSKGQGIPWCLKRQKAMVAFKDPKTERSINVCILLLQCEGNVTIVTHLSLVILATPVEVWL